LMFGALALGETTVRGLLEGEDVLATAAALRALGAEVTHERDAGLWRVRGFGVGGGREPTDVLELGNSGTSARLLSGILASHPFTSFMTGDASLRRRPMQRVIEPLSRMGARFEARDGGRMPLAIIGTDEMVPIEYRLPVASAQVKSAILLAGLNTAGETTVIEPEATRDHTERMLRHFGAEVRVMAAEGGGGPVADLRVQGAGLKGIEVPAERAPSMIDEYPILAVAASCAKGTTRMLGLAELRAKESDRLASVAAGLQANGVKHEIGAD